jgi:hypothetical protein
VHEAWTAKPKKEGTSNHQKKSPAEMKIRDQKKKSSVPLHASRLASKGRLVEEIRQCCKAQVNDLDIQRAHTETTQNSSFLAQMPAFCIIE